jgi:hypothetical protein
MVNRDSPRRWFDTGSNEGLDRAIARDMILPVNEAGH